MKYCPSEKKCGGCRNIHEPYENSLAFKQDKVNKLYAGKKVERIIGMEDPYHYRHKIYASFSQTRDGRIIAGMYEENTHRLIDSRMCLIQHARANAILQTICTVATDMKLEAYDEDRGTGTLRHAYLRVSHANQEVLVVIVIGSKDLPGSRSFVQKIVSAHPEIRTVILNWNRENTSMILGPKDKVLYGKGYIEDEIAGMVFRISAHTFYQVNPVQTEVMYSTALQYAQLKKTDTVLDMCCGIGTISLLAARKARYVLGVEVNPKSIQDAGKNAVRNHIRNAEFLAMDGEEFIHELLDTPDVVFLDPPRSGFSGSFMQALEKLGPQKIVYVSCNPVTQARDLKVIESNYRIEKIQPVDNFPFTSELECIVSLTRKNTQCKKKPH
ncbi:MAG: 23S rRNA (uracil(1939)-C(5))-methyltransferase RlmD [Erysipelotrichaceae bacterium]|nr:23S rRNA (uracil(1939)-C(5))-methyltransferase RlmD [Erysipelotrichaceae bacterium]MDY4808776.1 23S rRNA (uracil(1939)-C(5))-methyltransferase RlmD [Bulleidia sp.]